MTNQTGLDEAIRLVAGAQDDLEEAQEKLSSARSWGLFDIFAGGLITSLVKHGKIDDATQCVQSAKYKLESAGRVLNAGEGAIDAQLDGIDGFTKFFDVVSDSFLADLWVQGEIADRRRAVEGMLAKVRALRRSLENAKRP